MQQQFRQYLGDGIDFDFDGHRVILTSATGRVYLKPQQVESLKAACAVIKNKLGNLKRIPLK